VGATVPLARYLGNREKQWGILAVTEQRVQVKARRYRVPDITVLIRERRSGPVVRTPPFLCIEILSPGDRMSEMQERIDDSLAFGVLATSNPDIRVPFADLD
jgi:Uma2 family endonuclease